MVFTHFVLQYIGSFQGKTDRGFVFRIRFKNDQHRCKFPQPNFHLYLSLFRVAIQRVFIELCNSSLKRPDTHLRRACCCTNFNTTTQRFFKWSHRSRKWFISRLRWLQQWYTWFLRMHWFDFTSNMITPTFKIAIQSSAHGTAVWFFPLLGSFAVYFYSLF